MIQRLNLSLPLNALSLGQCSYNIVRELYRRKIQCVIWPKGNPDLSAYKIDPQLGGWIERAINSRFQKLDRKVPTLALWHIQDSQFKPSDQQFLFSFHETDSPTEAEVNIVNQQEQTFFSSSWTVDNFCTYGAQNVAFVPLGFDEDFAPIPERLVPHDRTQWILVGKAEQRKNTELIIKSWVKRYGGNTAHALTLCVTNPFFQPQQMEAFYAGVFEGKPKPVNVTILPHLKTNAEMNQLYNAADIDLGGLSGSEGWNIPSFTTTALGKWSIVTNATAHKDWATADNSILVEPAGMRPAHDGMFFVNGAQFSQGNIYSVTSEQINAAFDVAEKKAKTPNPVGEKLREMFTWKRTVDAILEKIGD